MEFVCWDGQLEQPGRRKPQCTLQGFIRKIEDIKLKEVSWLILYAYIDMFGNRIQVYFYSHSLSYCMYWILICHRVMLKI